jgi:hypothetical protein
MRTATGPFPFPSLPFPYLSSAWHSVLLHTTRLCRWGDMCMSPMFPQPRGSRPARAVKRCERWPMRVMRDPCWVWTCA